MSGCYPDAMNIEGLFLGQQLTTIKQQPQARKHPIRAKPYGDLAKMPWLRCSIKVHRTFISGFAAFTPPAAVRHNPFTYPAGIFFVRRLSRLNKNPSLRRDNGRTRTGIKCRDNRQRQNPHDMRDNERKRNQNPHTHSTEYQHPSPVEP